MTVLFAEAGMVDGYWVAIGSVISVVIGAATTAILTISRNRSELRQKEAQHQVELDKSRAETAAEVESHFSETRRRNDSDAVARWQEVVDRLKADLTRQDATIGTLSEDVRALRDELNKCHEVRHVSELENSKLKNSVAILEMTVRRMQQDQGLVSVNMPAVIIAKADGIIVNCSPSVGVMFHYLADELVGKNVTILIPERYREAHTRAMAKVKETGWGHWEEKSIVAFGLTREGADFPVTICLNSWVDDNGERLVAAEITCRKFRPPEARTRAADNPGAAR